MIVIFENDPSNFKITKLLKWHLEKSKYVFENSKVRIIKLKKTSYLFNFEIVSILML